jgi:hypothetical protein
MTTFDEQQKKRNLENFNTAVALYSILKSNSASLKVKQVVYRADEVTAEPIDYILDIEIKAKRAVGQRFYDMFLRAVYNENLDLLSETLRETLGSTFLEYGLGPEGTYRRLFYSTKNDQMRSYLKGANSGRPDTDNGAATNSTVAC